MSNQRPRLGVSERSLANSYVLEQGWAVTATAAAIGVGRQTVHKLLQGIYA